MIVETIDSRIQIWNLLRDAQVTAISQDGDTVTLFVSIPWLRRRLKPLSDSYILTLAEVSNAECRDFDGATSTLREELEMGTPEIRQSKFEALPATIKTTTGNLILDFQSSGFALETGQAVDYEVIEKAYEDYWTGRRGQIEHVVEHRPTERNRRRLVIGFEHEDSQITRCRGFPRLT